MLQLVEGCREIIRSFGRAVPVPELCAHTHGAITICAFVLRNAVMRA